MEHGPLGHRWWAVVIAGVMLGSGSGSAMAQTFYKWTDDHGVVHFADQVPTDAKKVEERHLPAVPQPQVTLSDDAKAGEGTATPGTTSDARVILETHEESYTGASTVHVSGTVKNVGGAAAQKVSVAISAVDSGQGTPCLQVEAGASPSTIGPGETGSFETTVESPCLHGDTPVVLNPDWK